MISQANVDNLIDALQNVQDRMAIGLNMENPSSRELNVFVSVTVSDRAGNIIQTIQTKAASSTWTARLKDGDSSFFAPGIPQKSHLRRVSTLSQVSSYIFAVNNRDAEVINATYRVQPVGSNTAQDYLVQTYLSKGTLVQKETQASVSF